MAKEYPPDRYLHSPDAVKEKLNVIFAYINEAYRALSRNRAAGGVQAGAKGHEDLIRAFTLAADQIKNAYAVIVGGGVLYSSLAEQIKAAGLEDRIKLLGQRDIDQGGNSPHLGSTEGAGHGCKSQDRQHDCDDYEWMTGLSIHFGFLSYKTLFVCYFVLLTIRRMEKPVS